MRRADHGCRFRPHGFTLFEVVASVAILGGVVVGLLAIQQRAQGACRLAQEIMTCTRLCAAQVALLRAGRLDRGEGEFTEPDGYTWQITSGVLPADVPDGLSAFRVRVSPGSGEKAGGVSVTIWLAKVEKAQP